MRWNAQRDAALVVLVADGGLAAAEVADRLSLDPHFNGETLTAGAVRSRCGDLRRWGLPIPRLRVATYEPDIDCLRRLLEAADEGPEGGAR